MSFRSATIRPLAFTTAALTAGALFAVALGAASAGATPLPAANLTVHVETATGLPATDAQIAFLPTADNSVDFSDLIDGEDAAFGAPVKGHPGTFSVALPSAGQYTALLLDGRGDGESAQWLGGSPLSLPDGAQYLDIQAGASTLDVSYATSGSISGTVKNASGKGLGDICVSPWAFDGANWYPSSIFGDCAAYTNSKGQYSFNPHSAGSYKVEFSDQDGRYLDQFDGGVASEEDATPVYLQASKSAVVNAALVLGGTLTGTVSGYDRANSEADLSVFQLTGTPGNFTSAEPITDATASSTGKFSIGGLPTGYYSIAYDVYNDDTDEEITGYIGGADALHATAFSVTAGHSSAAGTVVIAPVPPVTPTDVGEVDFTVEYNGVALPGQVDGDSGDALTLVSSSDGTQYYAQDAPSSATTYQFADLPVGDYQAFVSESGYLPVETDVTVVADGLSGQTIQLQLDSPLAFAAQSTFDGPAVVGDPLTASPGELNRPDAESSYFFQWYRETDGTKQLIRGAQSATYTPTGGDVADELFVRVTGEFVVGSGVNEQYIGSVTQMASAGSVVGSTTAITNSISPELAGTATVGVSVGVDGGVWSVTGPKLTYQWLVNGDPVGDPTTNSHFTPTSAQLGDTLAVQVTASKDGYPASALVTTDSVVVAAGAAPAVVTAPKVTAKSSHGTRSFSVSAAKWSLAGGTTTYAWTVDGAPAGTNSAKFSTTSTGAISLTIEYSVAGHTSGSIQKFVSSGVVSGYTSGLVYNGPLGAVEVAQGDSIPVGTGLFTFPSSTSVPDGSSFISQTFQLQRQSGNSWVKVASFGIGSNFNGLPTPSSVVGKTVRYVAFSATQHYGTIQMPSVSFTVEKNNLLTVTGNVVIPDQLPEGSTATVALSDYPSGTTHKYQWQVSVDGGSNWTPITHATSTSYTLPSIAVGNEVRIGVTSVNASSLPAAVYSNPLTVLDNTIRSVTDPRLSAVGPLRVGATVSVTAGTWNVAKTTYHYQWQSSSNGTDYTDIAKATSSSYKAGAADTGNTVRVIVTASRSGYVNGSEPSSGIEIDAVPGDKIVIHATPITGGAYAAGTTAPSPSDVFTSVNGLAGSSVKYQWKLNGKSISGAAGTGAGYSVKLADIGKKLQVTETLTSGVYGAASYTTAALTMQKGTLPFTLAEVDGNATAGNTVTALVGNGVSATIQWRTSSNGTDWIPIPGATHSTFTIPGADAGLSLDFVATTTKVGYASVKITGFSTSIAWQGTITGVNAPSISAPRVGVPTTVDNGDWSATGLAFSYQWHAGDNVIAGATGATFTPLGSDAGADLWVSIVASRSGWHSATASSDVDTVARGAQVAIHTKPVITGSAKTCSTLSVSTGSWSVPGVTVTYQWFEGDTALTGATQSTYLVSPGQLGSQLSVQLSATAIGYQSGSFTTTKTAAIAAGSTTCLP
jgi:hypothetical protein